MGTGILCFVLLSASLMNSSLGLARHERRNDRFRRSLGDWLASLLSKKVCYHEEGIGCFDNRKPFNYANGNLPDAPSTMGLEFLLYTRQNRQAAQLLQATPTSIHASLFDGSKETKVIIHGYMDNGRKHWVNQMKDALLTKNDMNVIVVDWKEGARNFDYAKVAANTRVVGAMVAKFLTALKSNAGAKYSSMHLIGQSLGSHVAGFAGSRIDKLGRITGLDPAGPLFEKKSTQVKLDSSDASFVDIIHTDGDPLLKLGFGIREASGHVDFFPNGGSDQPGCKTSLGSHLVSLLSGKGFKDIKNDVVCSHMRVTDLFTESINSPCNFIAFLCQNKSAFTSGSCTNACVTDCPVMGYNVARDIPQGQYYLRTNAAAPFCISA